MVAGADDGERATGSSPTDRQIPRTDTGRPLFLLSAIRAREEGAAALWLMAARWSPAPTMVSELRGHRQPIAKFRALTLAAPLFLLSPIRAREAGAAALWPMAARWSPAPTMVSELPGHRQPIAKFRALTLAACPRAQRYGFERSAE